jgi:hypothetical protein
VTAPSTTRCRSVIRTQPTSTERAARTLVVADDELGRAAADVHDQEGAVEVGAAGQFPGGAGEGERGLLVAGDHLGFDAEDVEDPAHEVGAVLGVPGGGGRDEPDPFGAVPLDDPGVLAAGGEGPLQRLGG